MVFISSKVKSINIKTLADVRKSASGADHEARDVRHLQYLLKEISKFPRIRGILGTRSTALTAYDWDLISDDNFDLSEERKRLSSYIEHILNFSTDNLYGACLFKVTRLNEVSEEGKNASLKLERVPHTEFQPVSESSFYIYDDEANVNNKRLVDMTQEDNANGFLYFVSGDANDIGGTMNANADNIIYLINLMPKWDEVNNKIKGIILGVTDGRTLAAQASSLSYGSDEVKSLQENYQNIMQSIGKDGSENVLLTLSGIDIKLSQLVDASAASAYSLYKNELQSDVAISLLGQANTTELPSGGGSRAALQVLDLVRKDILFSDISFNKRVINRFLEIEHYLSTGNKDMPYSFDFVLDDIIDTEANARKFQYVSNLGIPLEISEREFYAQLGISKAKDGEPTITLGNQQNSLLNVQNPNKETMNVDKEGE